MGKGLLTKMSDAAWQHLENIVFFIILGAIILRVIWPKKN